VRWDMGVDTDVCQYVHMKCPKISLKLFEISVSEKLDLYHLLAPVTVCHLYRRIMNVERAVASSSIPISPQAFC
jgi:hypothetical protein